MTTHALLLTALCSATLFSGCVDEGEGYGRRSVSVSVGNSRDYYGDGYDEYSPYYSYSGRRYYRTGGRYAYYSNRRPYYVATLPSGARYITPARRHRSEVHVVNRYDVEDRRNSPDWPR